MPEVEPSPAKEPVRLRSFLGESALYGVGTVADKVVGFLLLPLSTALLSPDDFGVLSVFGVTSALAFILVSLGIHQSVPILHAKVVDADERRRVFSTALMIGLYAAAALIVATFLAGSGLGSRIFGEGYGSLLFLLGPHTLLLLVRNLGCTRLRLQQRPQAFVAVNTLSTVAVRGAALALVAAGLGAKGWVLGELLGYAITLALLWPMAFADLSFDLDRKTARRLLPLGLAITPSLLAHWVMMGSDRYVMLFTLADAQREIGLYSIGERISTVMQLVNVAFVLGWQRFAFENLQRSDGGRRFAHGLTLYAVVGGYATFLLCLLGDDLTRFITPATYNGGVVVIPMLTLAGFVGGFAELTSARLLHANRGMRLGTATWIAAAVQVGLLFWAIPQFGILGAAGACLTGQSLKFALIVAAGWRTAPVEFEARRLLLLAFVLSAAYAVGGSVGQEDSLGRFLWQLGVSAVTPLLVVGSGFLTVDEKHRIANGVRRLLGRRTIGPEPVSEKFPED